MTPGQMMDALPYVVRSVVRITLHGPDLWHRRTWHELHLECGHRIEHDRGPVPRWKRCYACPRAARAADEHTRLSQELGGD